jgi:hypothetical protein
VEKEKGTGSSTEASSPSRWTTAISDVEWVQLFAVIKHLSLSFSFFFSFLDLYKIGTNCAHAWTRNIKQSTLLSMKTAYIRKPKTRKPENACASITAGFLADKVVAVLVFPAYHFICALHSPTWRQAWSAGTSQREIFVRNTLLNLQGLFLRHRIQTDSGAHQASYPMGTRRYFPGDKAAGEWSWPLTSI